MKNYTFRVRSITDLKPIAKKLLDSLGKKNLVALRGNMGSGKTTFVKTICEELKVEDVVNSPTFSILNQYSGTGGRVVYHFDYYRLEKTEEAINIGLFDYLDSGHLCLMEWPEKIDKLIPQECVYVDIKEDILSGEREISWKV
jgi:tRNA threonylcarbamoyladenosine biosynthesis protein TsaE